MRPLNIDRLAEPLHPDTASGYPSMPPFDFDVAEISDLMACLGTLDAAAL